MPPPATQVEIDATQTQGGSAYKLESSAMHAQYQLNGEDNVSGDLLMIAQDSTAALLDL